MDKDTLRISQDLANYIKNEYDYYYKKKKEDINSNIYRKINITMSSTCESAIAKVISNLIGNDNYNFIIDAYLPYKKEIGKRRKYYRPDIIIIDRKKGNKIVGIVEVKSQMGYCGTLHPIEFENKISNLEKSGYIVFSKEELEQIDADNDEKVNQFLNGLTINGSKTKKQIKFEFDDHIGIYVVNIMASNHMSNVENTIGLFDNDAKLTNRVHFYTLYERSTKDSNEKVWYYNLNKAKLFEDYGGEDLYIDRKVTINKKEYKVNYNFTSSLRNKYGFNQFVIDIKRIKN